MGDNTLSVNDILSKQHKEIQELKKKIDDHAEELSNLRMDISSLEDGFERFRYSKQWNSDNVVTVVIGIVVIIFILSATTCGGFTEYQKAKNQPKQLEQIKEVLQ